MNFAWNSWANILGLMKGLFNFAFGVPHDVFTYNCHVTNTVSYQAVRHCLEGLSSQEAKLVMKKGRTVNSVVVMDNVQNYLIQRDARIGHINTMNVGIAATFIKLEGISPNAFNFSAKMQSLEGSQRHQLTVSRLLCYIDQAHLDKVMSLHWLLILANYVPALAHIKKDILTSFQTTAVTHQMCLVLWTWRKLADETNAKNAPKICWKIVLTWGIQTALAIHITQSQDYPYAKNEYKLVIAIYRTRMTILMQETNAITDSHLSHENHQEAERIQWIMILVWERSAAFCSPTPIPEQPKKQKKQLRNEGEREESNVKFRCPVPAFQYFE